MFSEYFARWRGAGILDNGNIGTAVYNSPFTENGQILDVKLYAVPNGKPLKLGIFRLEGGGCRLRLVKEYVMNSVPSGLNTVRFVESLRFKKASGGDA